MTVTSPATDPTALAEVVAAAADAAARALPSSGGWRTEVVDPGDASAALVPPTASVAVIAGLGDSGARIVLLTGAPLARAVQVGPPPADDVAAGVTPAIEAALPVLAAGLGEDLDLGLLEEVAAEVALPQPGERVVVLAARLHDGDVHGATFALVVPVPAEAPADLAPHEFGDLPGGGAGPGDTKHLSLLHDVEMGVTAELGRARMLVRDILSLTPGSVIELDRAAGSPVDVLVNGTLIARGEVVVIDEEFGIRVTEIIGYEAGANKGRRRTDG